MTAYRQTEKTEHTDRQKKMWSDRQEREFRQTDRQTRESDQTDRKERVIRHIEKSKWSNRQADRQERERDHKERQDRREHWESVLPHKHQKNKLMISFSWGKINAMVPEQKKIFI